ncbi:hypothetical protein B0H19DRAFT_302069 [Mycena capillaripes]|nr:hypothetical protein B0H19DRAFT_302069 [Mycena capillaripes]
MSLLSSILKAWFSASSVSCLPPAYLSSSSLQYHIILKPTQNKNIHQRESLVASTVRVICCSMSVYSALFLRRHPADKLSHLNRHDRPLLYQTVWGGFALVSEFPQLSVHISPQNPSLLHQRPPRSINL